MADEFIDANEVVVSPRGRKVEINPDLAASLKKVKAGQAIILRETFGNVPKASRSAVSQIIRKHWRHVRNDDCRIDYDTAGVPQVRIRAAKI
jgi:hypothetical protein